MRLLNLIYVFFFFESIEFEADLKIEFLNF